MGTKKRRTNWWRGIKAIIREYPHSAKCADTLTGARLADFEAVKSALEQTEGLPNGKYRLEMVDIVFFRQSHTLTGAACRFPFCEREVRQWHTDFIRLVGKNRGLID